MEKKSNNVATNKIKSVITKIKNVKHIEIIIAVVAIAIMLLIFSSGSGLFDSNNNTDTDNKTVDTINNSTSYLDTEKQLSDVLSQIQGVGNVRVMINYSGTSEKVTAKTVTSNVTNTTNGGSSTSTTTHTTESPVVISNNGNSQPYILKEIAPDIIGVIVVAEGANNATVKLAIMRACQTILQVNANNIEIFTMK